MKKFVLLCVMIVNSMLLPKMYAQIFENPNIVYCLSNYFVMSNLVLKQIELTRNETILSFTYISSGEYENGGWVSINGGTYIEDVDKQTKYKLIRAEGIPISPKQHEFSASGQLLQFSLHFERIPKNLRKFNMIECTSPNCFNIYDITLDLTFEESYKYQSQLKEALPDDLWQFFYWSPGERLDKVSFDDATYNSLLKMDNVFNLKSTYSSAKPEFSVKTRMISFIYKGNNITGIFNTEKQGYNLMHVNIEFKTKDEASTFIKSFSNYFHMNKLSATHYTHSIQMEFGRFITLEKNSISINTSF